MAGAEAAAAAAGASASVADDTPACDDSACSTPFVSAPSSPTRDRDPYPSHFFSAPTSPTRGGREAISGVLDFDFDFSSRFPSPSAAAMSSADELFHNGQIRPVRLAAALLQPHPDPAVLLDFVPDTAAGERGANAEQEAEADERGRVRSRSVRRKARSMSPFRTHWLSASHAPEPESADEAKPAAVGTPAASRSSSSSSTASSASSTSTTSSRASRRWGGFLKDLLHRSKSDGGRTSHHHQHSHHSAAAPAPPTAAAAKTSASSPSPSPSPAPAKGRGGAPGHRGGGRRRSAHERLYEARRAEAEEMRRRTSLPYRQGLLLFGCIGLGNRSYGAVHGLARGLNAAAAVSSRS